MIQFDCIITLQIDTSTSQIFTEQKVILWVFLQKYK